MKRLAREVSVLARFGRQLLEDRTWTLGGARALLALMRDGRKDMYAQLFAHAENTPDKPAVVESGRVTSFAELNALACRFGNGLFARGVRRGDKVIIALGNSTEALVSTAGGAHLGAVIVPCSKHYLDKELAHIVANSEAKIVCLTEKQWHALSSREWARGRTVALLERAEPDTIAWRDLLGEDGKPKRERRKNDADLMLYTSGTTGKPKGAMLNMQKVSYLRALQLIASFGFRASTRFYTACPVYHAAPTALIGFCFTVGGTVHIDDKFDAEAVWRYLDEAEITIAFFVPTQIARLLNLPEHVLAKKPRALERILSGGAPLPLPLKRRALERLGDVVYDFYGATELGLVSLATPRDLHEKPGTIGRPLPGVDVRFEDGELYVRSDQFDFGYYKNESATKATELAGYRSVGDIGYQDDDGYLFVIDRKSDLIISGGVNIYPAEIEQVLLEHPKIDDAAVIGLPDAEWGEAVTAFVVLRPSQHLEASEVIAYCASKLASLKKPKRVVFLDELPRSPQGKVLKRTLRARFE